MLRNGIPRLGVSLVAEVAVPRRPCLAVLVAVKRVSYRKTALFLKLQNNINCGH